MLPPDTLVTTSTPDRRPSSLSRRTAPRWNRVARNPPPDRQRAVGGAGMAGLARGTGPVLWYRPAAVPGVLSTRPGMGVTSGSAARRSPKRQARATPAAGRAAPGTAGILPARPA